MPLSVGLADRPVDLLLGERAAAVAAAPVPPVALPPSALPDFDLAFPAAFPGDFTAVPPTAGFSFPSFTAPTTTIPAGCTATPPERHFDDSPDNVVLPPIETPEGNAGYVARTSGRIEVGADEVTTMLLPQLTQRRVENIEIHERFPTTNPVNQMLTYPDNATSALGQPADFSFDVVVDVGKADHNTRTKYRVRPGYVVVTGFDSYTAAPDGSIFGLFPDGRADDFFTDRNRDGWIEDLEMFLDVNKNGSIDTIERYFDLNGDGVITTTPSSSPTMPTVRDERYRDMSGDGFIGGWVTNATTGVTTWRNSAPIIDTNGDGVGDRSETLYPNQRYHYTIDGLFDSASFQPVGGGFYLVSMQTGKQPPVVYSKVADADGQLVNAPGALLAALPLVESATINSKTFDASGKTAIQFESTVFGRSDVDVCRTDLVTWKIELERGLVVGESQALDFTASYSLGSQYGGLFLAEKSTVTSIQVGQKPVRRVIETVFTTEPEAAAMPTS